MYEYVYVRESKIPECLICDEDDNDYERWLHVWPGGTRTSIRVVTHSMMIHDMRLPSNDEQ